MAEVHTPPGLDAADRRTELLAVLALLWSAALFGTSFVVVKGALDDGLRPVPYVAFRMLLAGLVFAVLARGRPGRPGEWRLGVLSGLSYTVGMVCQTLGLERTTPSTSAFLTYLLVVAVPILDFFISHRRPPPIVVVAIAVSVAGLALLTGGGVGFGVGELLTVIGAIAFALHVIQVGQAAGRCDPFRYNAIQVLVVAAVLLPLVPFTGGLPEGAQQWGVVVYAALFVTVLTFLPWMWAQRYLSPTRASLVLLTEPVWATAASYVQGERLGAAALAGAALILAGAVLAEAGPLLRGRRG